MTRRTIFQALGAAPAVALATAVGARVAPRRPKYVLTQEEAEVLAEALHGPHPETDREGGLLAMMVGSAAAIGIAKRRGRDWEAILNDYKAEWKWKPSAA